MTIRKTAAPNSHIFFLAMLIAFGWFVQFPAAAQMSATTRAYSMIDDVRANKHGSCKVISRNGDNEDPVLNERCPPGPHGWPVSLFSSDGRVYVSFGRQSKAGATVMDALDGAFADPHSVIEWRLRDGKPYAAIHRYFFDGKQVLTIHKLNQDRTSCVAAVVWLQRGRDANTEAIRIADEVVPAFKCGDDKLIAATPTQSSD